MALLTAHDARLVNGDLPNGFTSMVSGAEAVAQRLWLRFAIHQGEWFADPTRGLPWKFWTSQAMTPGLQGIIEQRLRAEAATVPGIQTVVSVQSTWDPVDAHLAVTIAAEIEDQVYEIEFATSAVRYGNANLHISRRLSPSRSIRS